MDQQPAIRLVIFDWAGTTVDFGCFAPVAPFIKAVANVGVEVTMAEARGPMGMHKRDHLQAILRMPAVAERFRTKHGRDWNDADLDRMYADFVPLQMEEIGSHCELVPGALECVQTLRSMGIRIGTSTGYFRAAAERTYESARDQGYEPDYNVCGEDVAEGRPAPWMIFRNMEALGVYPPCCVLKIGDTLPDIEEGLNAGAWSLAVTRTSSEVGLTREQFDRLSEADRTDRCSAARERFLAAGAHAVVDSLAELPGVIRGIDAMLAKGASPTQLR